MNPAQLAEIEEKTGEYILTIFRSDKIRPSDVTKAEIGLKYLKTITGMNYQKFSSLVQFAGLYSAEHREDIAKNIILPRFQLCGDVTTDPGEIKSIFEDLRVYKQEKEIEKQEKDIIVMDANKRVQAAENKVEDLKDELELKGKSLLQEIAKEEYKLKRDILK